MQQEQKVSLHADNSGKWLAVLRIFVGLFFLHVGIPKLLNPTFYQMMEGMLKEWTGKGGPAWYTAFLLNVVMPNSGLFATLVAVGETAVGLLMLVGFLTRVSGAIGAFMTINYYLATVASKSPSAMLNIYATVVFIVLVATCAGRVWGIDYWLAKKRSRSVFW